MPTFLEDPAARGTSRWSQRNTILRYGHPDASVETLLITDFKIGARGTGDYVNIARHITLRNMYPEDRITNLQVCNVPYVSWGLRAPDA